MTYWPFAYSKPFTISFESTGTLSVGQMYGRFRAVMHVACKVVKERSFVSVAPYSLTGMFTRPNAIAPLHKARAIVGSSRGISTKGHEAINNLSCMSTLFKVNFRE